MGRNTLKLCPRNARYRRSILVEHDLAAAAAAEAEYQANRQPNLAKGTTHRAVDLDQDRRSVQAQTESMAWQRIESAPFDRDIELAVLDEDGVHAIAFACRRAADGWVSARSKRAIDVRPTHWRLWADES